jgi:hypothetical protein
MELVRVTGDSSHDVTVSCLDSMGDAATAPLRECFRCEQYILCRDLGVSECSVIIAAMSGTCRTTPSAAFTLIYFAPVYDLIYSVFMRAKCGIRYFAKFSTDRQRRVTHARTHAHIDLPTRAPGRNNYTTVVCRHRSPIHIPPR